LSTLVMVMGCCTANARKQRNEQITKTENDITKVLRYSNSVVDSLLILFY
jgi:hypothetical protein